MIVEDDRTILESFKDILECEGYIVDTARNGREAMEKSESRNYDLVLLDLKLPDVEGMDLLTRLNQISPRLIIIMVTAHAKKESADVSLSLGADAFITKPVNPEDLVRFIEEKLRRHREREMIDQEVT